MKVAINEAQLTSSFSTSGHDLGVPLQVTGDGDTEEGGRGISGYCNKFLQVDVDCRRLSLVGDDH